MDDVFRHIDEHEADIVAQLTRLCRQPSVSAQGEGLDEMARLLAGVMSETGIATRVLPSSTGVPMVVGELSSPGADRTLLFYNHYDVQPPDPRDEWLSPPFEPAVRDGRVFARGATDNKGNIVSRLAAVRALLERRGSIPVNLKFLIEGQEEISSPGLSDFLRAHADELHADACVWEDTMGRIDAPVVSLGSKGMCQLELRCKVADLDSHSAYAGIYPNAIWRLVWALATIRAPDGTVLVEGFRDALRPLSDDERRMVEELPGADVAELKRIRGLRTLLPGVDAENLHARQSAEPTLNISGIAGGYQGEGSKTVIPAQAMARVDIRLVPDQEPEAMAELIRRHLAGHGFDDVEVVLLGASLPSRSPLDNALNRAIAAASRSVYGTRPIFEPHQAGSTPQWVIGAHLGIPCSATGVGYVTCMSHAPNENIRIDHLIDGAKYMAAIIEEFARA